jgi:hypothetical protein
MASSPPPFAIFFFFFFFFFVSTGSSCHCAVSCRIFLRFPLLYRSMVSRLSPSGLSRKSRPAVLDFCPGKYKCFLSDRFATKTVHDTITEILPFLQLGLLSTTFRQTNIVWVMFIAASALISELDRETREGRNSSPEQKTSSLMNPPLADVTLGSSLSDSFNDSLVTRSEIILFFKQRISPSH